MVNIETLPEEEQRKVLARRAYQKKWRAMNKDKCKAYSDKFFQKQAEKNSKAGN